MKYLLLLSLVTINAGLLVWLVPDATERDPLQERIDTPATRSINPAKEFPAAPPTLATPTEIALSIPSAPSVLERFREAALAPQDSFFAQPEWKRLASLDARSKDSFFAQPEWKRLASLDARSYVDRIYAPLLRQLGLGSADEMKVISLLVEKRIGELDAERIASTMAIAPSSTDLDLIRGAATAHAVSEMNRLLGGQKFAVYQQHEGTLYQRAKLDILVRQLRSSSSPLSDEQLAHLASVLPGFSREDRFGIAAITDAQAAAAESVLSSEQIEAFRGYRDWSIAESQVLEIAAQRASN